MHIILGILERESMTITYLEGICRRHRPIGCGPLFIRLVEKYEDRGLSLYDIIRYSRLDHSNFKYYDCA